MTVVSLTQQQHQQFIDRIFGLEARMATLQTHAEAQQEQIRVAEMVIQQLRTAGGKSDESASRVSCCFSEAGDSQLCVQGIDKVHWGPIPSTTTGPSTRDESLQERTRDLLDHYSGYRVRSMRSTRTMCLSTEERHTTDMDWLNSELYALLAIKTAETAMASMNSLEEVEVKGIIGWHRLEREAASLPSTSCGASQGIGDSSGKSAESH